MDEGRIDIEVEGFAMMCARGSRVKHAWIRNINLLVSYNLYLHLVAIQNLEIMEIPKFKQVRHKLLDL